MSPERITQDPFAEQRKAAVQAVGIYARIIAMEKIAWDADTANHVGIRYAGYMNELFILASYDPHGSLQNRRGSIIDHLNTVVESAQINGYYKPLREMFESQGFMEVVQGAQRTKIPYEPFQRIAHSISDEGLFYQHVSASLNQPEICTDAKRFLEPKQR